MHNKVYTLPFGAQVDDVKVTFSGFNEKEIIKSIQPPPASYVNTDLDVYSKQLFSFRIGTGVNSETYNNCLLIYFSPVQYHPNNNSISCFESAKIDATYTPPENPNNSPDKYYVS